MPFDLIRLTISDRVQDKMTLHKTGEKTQTEENNMAWMLKVVKVHMVTLDGSLTLKAPFRTAADDTHKYFFIVFTEKIGPDISCESSAKQRIHMKHQALFSLIKVAKKKKKHVVCCKFCLAL